MSLNISIVAEPVFYIGRYAITNSLLSALLVTIFFIFIAIKINSSKLEDSPKGNSLQNLLEIILEGFLNLYTSVVGSKMAKEIFPILTTIFVYILFSNWSGLIPGVGPIGVWEEHHGEKILIPLFRAPTADLNTTIMLSLIAFVFIQYYGIRALGIKYIKKFFANPIKKPIFAFVGFLELVGEFVKIISFSFRLFGNIFAGEVLLAVMAFLFPLFLSIPFIGLELFVGIIQSLVFVMLMLVFTATATQDSH